MSNILSLHPELGWISGYIDYFPQQPFLSVLNRIQDIKAIESFSRGRKKYPRPGEAYKFWKHYFPDFNSPADYKMNADNTDNKPQQCIQAIESIPKYSGKQRFITKITGLPRNRQLAQVFENPYIIYINRDPRAVVMSYYKQRWGYKTEPEAFKAIPFEKHIEVYTERYRASWDGVKELKKFQFLSVNYEDLVEESDNFFDKILEFTRLEKSSKFVQ
ncbi:MAG: sulfotransferase, partial [Acidobacteriota bacterium]